MIPGGTSYKTMEKIGHVQHVADDPDAPEALRELATTELARIEAGGPVDPAYQRIRAAAAEVEQARQAELHALAEEAVARVTGPGRGTKRKTPATETVRAPGRWPVAAFVQTWTSLAGWWTHYAPDELAAELTDDQARVFLTVVDGTVAFADRLRPLLTIDPAEVGEAGDDAAGEEPAQHGAAEEGAVPPRHLRAL